MSMQERIELINLLLQCNDEELKEIFREAAKGGINLGGLPDVWRDLPDDKPD